MYLYGRYHRKHDGRIVLDLIGHDIYMTDVGLIPRRIRSQVDLTSQHLDMHEHDRSVKLDA